MIIPVFKMLEETLLLGVFLIQEIININEMYAEIK